MEMPSTASPGCAVGRSATRQCSGAEDLAAVGLVPRSRLFDMPEQVVRAHALCRARTYSSRGLRRRTVADVTSPGHNRPLGYQNKCTILLRMECASRGRLAAAMALRRPELWDSNPRLAERIEMPIKDGQRAHRQARGGSEQAEECLAERHPELSLER